MNFGVYIVRMCLVCIRSFEKKKKIGIDLHMWWTSVMLISGISFEDILMKTVPYLTKQIQKTWTKSCMACLLSLTTITQNYFQALDCLMVVCWGLNSLWKFPSFTVNGRQGLSYADNQYSYILITCIPESQSLVSLRRQQDDYFTSTCYTQWLIQH